LRRATPVFFVLIWATGFIVARLVAPHTEPLTFLSLRFALSGAAFAALCFVTGAAWPATARAWGSALAIGMLMQGVYLGGIFWATHRGLPASVTALITGLQPLLTAVLAFPVLGERVSPRRWLGIIVGFAGAMLVVVPSLRSATGGTVLVLPILACLASMLAMTGGTFIQKRLPHGADLRVIGCVQFLGGVAIVIPMAVLTEGFGFDGSWQAWTGLGWAAFGLSIGATSLLMVLIRRGAVAGVASLFYLVPPVVAVLAFVLFGEQLAAIQIGGMVLAAIGVSVASKD